LAPNPSKDIRPSLQTKIYWQKLINIFIGNL
jgi:hypothetical protein